MEQHTIHLRTPEESRRVQQILFNAGYMWPHYDNKVMNTDEPFLFMHEDGGLGFTNLFDFTSGRRDSHPFLNSKDVTPKRFPPIQPGKMITVDGREVLEASIRVALTAHFGDWPK